MKYINSNEYILKLMINIERRKEVQYGYKECKREHGNRGDVNGNDAVHTQLIAFRLAPFSIRSLAIFSAL